jgi:hypothetical protein
MKADGNSQDEQRGERAREENLRREPWQRVGWECIARQNSNSISATLIFNTKMVSMRAHSDTRSLRAYYSPPESVLVFPESFSPGVDALDSRATGNEHTPGETSEQREVVERAQ